jgi:hypothetical protein
MDERQLVDTVPPWTKATRDAVTVAARRESRRLMGRVIAVLILFAGTAHAQPASIFSNPDCSDSAGEWDIEGIALDKGHTIICKMQKETDNGAQFADVFMISAGSNGMAVVDAYITPTTLPEGSAPQVAIFFDGTKATALTGGVQNGFLHADIDKLEPLETQRIVNLFMSSKTLVEVASLKGHPSEKATVDLVEANDAFDKRGKCSKDVMDIGLARMRNAKQPPDELPVEGKGNAECWGDDSRQDISCRALTESFLFSMRGATKQEIIKVMNVGGREIGGGLHFISNYSKGERWGSGSVNFTFDEEGRVSVIVASIDPPNMDGKSVDFIWNVYAAPPLGKEIDRSTKDFARQPYCSDFSGSSAKCSGHDLDSELTRYQMSFGSDRAELLQTLEMSCNLGSDPAGDCDRLRRRLR